MHMYNIFPLRMTFSEQFNLIDVNYFYIFE